MDTNSKEILLSLIKYSNEDRLKQLQSGKLYFNTLEFFEGCDNNAVGDKYERVYKQTIGKGVTIDLRKEFFDISVESIRLPDGNYLSTYKNEELFINIFCLYAVTDQSDFNMLHEQLPPEMKDFGSHMLIIQDVTEFIRRVELSLTKLNLNFHTSPVKYIDFGTTERAKSYFEKPIRYKYQREFRFAFKNTVKLPQVIDIGNIEDISVLVSIEKCKSIRIYQKTDDMIEHLVEVHRTLMKNHFDAIVAYNSHVKSNADSDKLASLLEDFNVAVEQLKAFEESYGLVEYREKVTNSVLNQK